MTLHACLSVVLLVTLAQRPAHTILSDIKAKLAELEAILTVTVCDTTCDLQAALNQGGTIEFEGTHTAPDRFIASVPGTRLKGKPGAKLIGGQREAIVIPPGASDIHLTDFEAASKGPESVVRVGANDASQPTSTVEPYGIVLKDIKIPTHRGKRGFEINARDVVVETCEVRDTWSLAQVDSQGLAIFNSSGNITVLGGYYEAGSENILVGGDWMKMQRTVTSTLVFDGVTLRKPLSWRTDGVNRVVKNLFELKTGVNVTLKNSTLDGSWVAAQTGFAIVLTPTRDGQVRNVLIENNTITNVGGGVQMLGRAYSYYTPTRLSVTFRKNNFTINHLLFGGTGRLATMEAEPDVVEFLDNTYGISGTSLMTYAWGNVKEADGTVRPGGPANRITLTGNTGTTGAYGLNFLGFTNCGPKQEGFKAATVLEVTGNTLGGAATLFKTNFPGNTWQ